jgi:hypothetical protein
MKLVLFSFLLFYSLSSTCQGVIPVKNFNNFFMSFNNGFFNQIEVQAINGYKGGDELVAYIDTRGNLRLYDGKVRKDITNLNVDYRVSDHLLGYKIGPTLNMWDAGRLQTLTYFGREFMVMDSLIVYEDTRFNTLNVYWNKTTTTLATVMGELSIPSSIGENMLVFKDNGNLYKIFWQGLIFEIGSWNGGAIDFQIGTDILCFNDPTTRTFVAFQNGQFIDVQPQFMRKYKAGRGFIAYEDLNGNLWMYKNGQTEQLSNFSPSFWDVKDDLVMWSENSYLFAYSNDRKIEVANFMPTDYLLKNNILAFRNIMGGVSALVDGKIEEITNVQKAEYEIYGNSVLVKLFNQSNIVFQKGQKYTN